jgi:nucleotide-binding universal stress UspA family protein
MKIFKNILVAHNGTKSSDDVFKKALSIAYNNSTDILVLTCLEERPTLGFIKTKTSKKEYEKEFNLTTKLHKNLVEYAAKVGIKCKSKIVTGSMASKKILEYADKHDIDLVIMGKKKKLGHYENYYYNSTLGNVFANINCALLII